MISPGIGNGAGWIAGTGTVGTGFVTVVGAGGIGYVGYDGYTIYRDWHLMTDDAERFERIGTLLGPILAGGYPGYRGFRAGYTAATSPRIIFGHGARHLEGSGLSQAAVESAIQGSVRGTPNAGTHWGWVQVNGQWIQYRAFVLPNDTINIGTYVRVPGNLSIARVP